MHRLHWTQIPAIILYNFKIHCGYDPHSIRGITFEEYNDIAQVELKPYHAYRQGDYYVFESKAHYQWFLLRWV